jgi:ribosomal protein S18 acetylase RimI-like enzyme
MEEITRSPYGRGPLGALDGALDGKSSEYRALAATEDQRIVGLVVYGTTAGAEGAGRLYLVAIDRGARMRGIATSLVEAAVHALGGEGARFVTVEIPDDPTLAASRSLLARCGFRVEAKVAEYVRAGVGLVILRRNLGAAGRQ